MSDEPTAFLEYFRGNDDPVMDGDDCEPDFFQKTFEMQKLAQAGIDPVAFAAESAPRTRAGARHYQNISEFQKRLATGSAPRVNLSPRLQKLYPGLNEGMRAIARQYLLEKLSEGAPLAKGAAITDEMFHTLALMRPDLLPEEYEAAEKAARALDLPLFLKIVQRAVGAQRS